MDDQIVRNARCIDDHDGGTRPLIRWRTAFFEGRTDMMACDTGKDIVERLRMPSSREDTMEVWDGIREMLLDGMAGSLPRDIFEIILDNIDKERLEAAAEIERLRSATASSSKVAAEFRLDGWLYDHRFNGAEHEDGVPSIWESETQFSKTEPRADFRPYSNIRAVYTMESSPKPSTEK
jgi:hypothetical protein